MEEFQPAIAARSVHSRNRIYIRFQNLTNRCVDIIWINFTGEYVKYQRLDNRNFIDINTFETHPWIAIDSEKKDRMLIDKQFIYIPQTRREYFLNHYANIPIGLIPQDFNPRFLITITIPVYSLRYRTLLEVRSYLQNENDVDSLDLPKELRNDLKTLVLERNRFPR